ncbi:hypothetical protein COV19_05530 [Candidatus Woesearchaeota archaeon CG10_big_fil_rev_8_21_14_0_10_44_13]|nr:MAG: hypothetical protein COV19_05530 [Candidatus Woesearchaeota archaeon CG10_big_fil_rev_8_21_14_0_10_44_13]
MIRIGIDARGIKGRMTGIGRYTYNLIENIAKEDKEDEYVLLVNDEVQLKEFTVKNGNFRIRKTWVKPISIFEQFFLPFLLLKEKISVFHGCGGSLPLWQPKKCIITVHDITGFKIDIKNSILGIPLLKIYIKFFVKNEAKKARRVVTDSESTKKDIVDELGIKPEKINVVYLAASDQFRVISKKASKEYVKKRFNIKKPFILYHGNKKPHKNIIKIIQAFSRLDRKKSYNLVITGKDDSSHSETDMSSIKREVKRRDVDEEVVFTGYVSDEDAVHLYNSAEVFVFPSYYEGFGLPVLEAMKCGCPVITSNISSLPEVAGNAGILVDPDSVEDIKNSIERVLSDKSLREKMRKKGIAQSKRFSWKTAAKEILSVYREVADEKD